MLLALRPWVCSKRQLKTSPTDWKRGGGTGGTIDKRLHPDWKNKNLEVVLATKVIDSKTGSPLLKLFQQ